MKPRNIVEVIDAMIAALPPEEPGLIAQLRRIKSDSGYTAPEDRRGPWEDLTYVFNRRIFGTDDMERWRRELAPEWADRAGRILAGEIET